jgi:hypothetical protein
VEPRHLEHFVVLVEELNFTKAAARLNLVQSGLRCAAWCGDGSRSVCALVAQGFGCRESDGAAPPMTTWFGPVTTPPPR